MPARKRNQALDFTRGVLVILMVVYHWANHFIGSAGRLYDLLRFLTPSFIFIAGFVVSVLHDRIGPPDFKKSKRLWNRGAKILLIFTILNCLMYALSLGNRVALQKSRGDVLDELFGIYISGNSSAAAFKVLVPIGYTLLLAPFVFMVMRNSPRLFWLLAVALPVGIQVGEAFGWVSFNLTLISFGLLGIASGCAGFAHTGQLARKFPLTIALCFAYLALILWLDALYWIQVIGVFATLLLIYGIGEIAMRVRDGFGLALIGRYSLIGYIGQIAILYVLKIAFREMGAGSSGVVLALPAALLLTVLMIFMVDFVRTKSKVTDACYKLAFA